MMGSAANATIRTTQHFWNLCVDGRFEAAAAMMRDDFVHDDRRRALANRISGREATMENNRMVTELGFDSVELEQLAASGERLALARVSFRSSDEHEVVALHVLETDADGLRTCCVSFDEAEIDAARAELEHRAQAVR